MPELQNSTTKQWYVVHTRTGEENAVVLRLQDRMRSHQMEDRFGEIVVPTEEVVEMRAGGEKRKTERKFFPGYVWVEMIMNAETWHFIKDIPGVIGFIGGKNPTPIPASQANLILRKVQEGINKPRPKITFAAGEIVRIIDGPFTDFNGVVEDVNYEKNRLRVSVLIFGRSTPVELEFGQVEKS
jgi:transcription termination/antitermination protein NusG